MLANKIVAANGYSTQRRQSRRALRMEERNQSRSEIPLCLPFISDKVSVAIQRCVVQAQLNDDVILVNIPNDNIK